MRILLIIPPHIPSYFNAGHHLPLFQVGAYLRKRLPWAEVSCVDGAALNIGWREVCTLLAKPVDAIGMMNDFDGIDTFGRFLSYVSELCPTASIFTFGRLSKTSPKFFQQLGFDGVLCSGDYEPGVELYLRSLRGEAEQVPGFWIKTRPTDEILPGVVLPSESWVLPDVTEIPYLEYGRMYQNDLNKYCGIPECLELVVPVARGCPVGCSFCDVPLVQGHKERRLPVDTTISYIREAFSLRRFEYVSFY